MTLKVNGSIKEIHKSTGFTKKDGTDGYKKGLTITTEAKYNPDIHFDIYNEQAKENLGELNVGDEVDVSFNLSSRNYEGKYYHNVTAWKVSKTEVIINEDKGDNPF